MTSGEVRGAAAGGEAPAIGALLEALAVPATARAADGLPGVTDHARALREVAERHEQEMAELVGRHERRVNALLEHLTDVVSVHRLDGELVHVASCSEQVRGDATHPPPVASFVHPEDLSRAQLAFAGWVRGDATPVTFRGRTGRDAWRHYESVGVNLLDDPDVGGVVVMTRDITDRVVLHAQLERQALHDPLTRLPGRGLFADRVEHALLRADRTGEHVAVLVVDIDGFKVVNDTYGHGVGDEVLAAVSERMQAAVRPEDTVARLGGDEFAVCCESIGDRETAELVASRIAAAFAAPVQTRARSLVVSVSIGVAVVPPGGGIDGSAVLRNADAAMYQAKERGRHRVEVFSEDLRARVQRRARLRNDLGSALQDGELAVHYQPQVRLSTGELVGFEALVRWTHPELGPVGPDEFIPIAEETGFILPLGRFVLDTACRQLATWQATHAGPPSLTMAVNLSARQLTDPGLAAFLRELLASTDVDPATVCLEITESVVMERADESQRRLQELKACGVQLAVDDFGTGYSSLAYLKRFPLDWLKIDREFVKGIQDNPEDRVIIASVLRLASSLHLEVLAEGVELPEHRDDLAALGCEYGQGYLWSRPLPPGDLDVLVAGTHRPAWDPALVTEQPPAWLDDEDSASIDEVLAVLRHELANPVTVIQGYTELLLGSGHVGNGAHLRGALDAISRSTAGLQELIVALTDLRAMGAGTVQLHREGVDLADLVHEVVGSLAEGLADHPTTVDVQKGAVVLGDERRISEIVGHLLGNAVKHTPPGTPVEVRVSTSGDRRQVVVADRGPGIPPEQVGLLFRKFVRFSGSDGTGLGLFLARGLARAHGGDVVHRQRPGGGSEFVLDLPVAPAGGTDLPRVS